MGGHEGVAVVGDMDIEKEAHLLLVESSTHVLSICSFASNEISCKKTIVC